MVAMSDVLPQPGGPCMSAIRCFISNKASVPFGSRFFVADQSPFLVRALCNLVLVL